MPRSCSACIRTTTRVFSAKGYHASLVDEIAAEADTSKGGVYFHFPNKQAIFLALLDRLAVILRERVETAVAAQSDPIARADAALHVVLQTFGSHRRLARLFMVEALGAGPEFNVRMIQIRADFADLIRRLIGLSRLPRDGESRNNGEQKWN